MALTKRGKYWHLDFIYRGKRIQMSTDQTNIQKARLVESKVRSDVALEHFGIGPPKASPNLKDFLEGRFLDFCRRHAKKDRTAKFWAEKTRRLVAYAPFAEARLSAIDEDAIESYKAHRLKSVSVTAVNRELACLRKALRLAYEWKHIARIPTVRQLPGEKVRKFIVSADLEKAYFAAAEYPLKQAAVLMLDLGLRPEECVRLKADAVSSGVLTVQDGKSAAAARALPMTQRAIETVDFLRALWPQSEWLFPGKKAGTHITRCALDCMHARLRSVLLALAESSALAGPTPSSTVVNREWMPARAQDFVLYSFRHTFGTRLAETSHGDAYAIKKAMGHSSVTISEKYVHTTDEHMTLELRRKELMDRMVRGEVQEPAPEKSKTS